MTPSELREIEERAEKAVAGPWVVRRDDRGLIKGIGNEDYLGVGWWGEHASDGGLDVREETAEFVAAARSDVPKLCAEVRRLRAWLQSRAGGKYDEENWYTPMIEAALRGDPAP